MEADSPRVLLVSGAAALAATEAALLVFGRREWLPPVAGIAVALTVFLLLQLLAPPDADAAQAVPRQGHEEVLERWLARAALLTSWSEGSREDWDLHLRPLLAREFALSCGIAKRQDPQAHTAAGLMLFGADLWPWVDPDNNAKTAAQRAGKGPGQEAFGAILACLENA